MFLIQMELQAFFDFPFDNIYTSYITLIYVSVVYIVQFC